MRLPRAAVAALTSLSLLATSVAAAQETGTAVAEDGTSEVTGPVGGVEVNAGVVALGLAALAALGLAFAIAADSSTSTTTTTTTTTTGD
jgi:hypothetical protein